MAGVPGRHALAVLALLGLAGCNAGSAREAAEPVATTEVDMPRHYRYAPVAIRVEAGSVVTWRNSDDFTHSVRFETGADRRVYTIPPGDSARIRFDAPGEYPYVCTFHPHDMTGVVVVTPAAGAAGA